LHRAGGPRNAFAQPVQQVDMPAKPIRAVARALEVLEALNRQGTATALALARETGIPRPTVYRLLETLVGTGHVGAMLGRRLPMLESSMGRAYLAFCPARERTALLRMLGAPAGFARRLAEIRRRGYSLRAGGGPWPHTGSVALPILSGGRLLGCINAIWMARAVPPEEGIRQCLGPLRETAALIESAIRANPA
jgi:DNA-binding IclR family transcriptional regulator